MLNGFMLEADGRLCTESEGFREAGRTESELENGSISTIGTFVSDDGRIRVQSITTAYRGSEVTERRIEVINQSEQAVRITRIDSIHGLIPKDAYTLDYFEGGGNGNEFTPRRVPLAGTKVLETKAGRSSCGMHPWFALRGSRDGVLGGTVAWSGNWIIRFEPAACGAYRVSGGLNSWEFLKTLRPGEKLESVPVLYASLPEGGLDEISVVFGRWGKRYWYPANSLSRSLPAVWNHWWPYEDSAINEEVFKANADAAAELGLEICILDAGWFGEPDPHCNDHLGWSTHVDWYLKRGDWHKVNTRRFPSGIAALSDYVHAKGLKFGIWCEIEALGAKAELASLHPEFPAARDGVRLGYVCLGNPEAQEWAFGVLEHLIVDYKADWIKLDFNLDPKAGCSRCDHGHGEGDGLYEHYRGYYELLARVRERYPEVYLENCSSGGLRIDLGLARHTHGAFLSDPDYTRHHLQLFWGATSMLHPSACYHFTWSQTIIHYDSNVDKDPIKEGMPRSRFDYFIRANMLNHFGCSYRLPELPAGAKLRLAEHIAYYKNTVRRFVASADMHRLTGPALRDGTGEGWNAFLYVTEASEEALLFVFRLACSEVERRILLKGLDAEATYEVSYRDSRQVKERSGRSLLEEGLLFSGMDEESSEVIELRRRLLS